MIEAQVPIKISKTLQCVTTRTGLLLGSYRVQLNSSKNIEMILPDSTFSEFEVLDDRVLNKGKIKAGDFTLTVTYDEDGIRVLIGKMKNGLDFSKKKNNKY